MPGETYSVNFSTALDDFGSPTSATMNVSVAGTSQNITATNVALSTWQQQSVSFVAGSATETLAFEGVSSNGSACCGVILDGISVTAGSTP